TGYFKKQLKKGKKLNDILPEAFAVLREAIKRTIGERAYDVQLMSAICLHQGSIAEQRTGEGKTHSVIFPAYLNSLTNQGVHIITPNDYLSRVGAGWYSPALHLLGVSVAGIIHEKSFVYDPKYTDPDQKDDHRLTHLKPISRQQAYQADITYGTNNEFGFDYLRDHMTRSQSEIVQRPHNFAIVDEVDFVLIDEARTPLIISSPGNTSTDKYKKYADIADKLQESDYVIDEKSKSATLSEYGIRKVERLINVKNLYEESFETIHYVENAIKAKAIFKKDREYVVKNNQVIIVDEFTGRLMYGRRWSDGLHQAVEAKEGVTVQKESQTWATITFQNYFRLYKKLAGMTGTANTEASEFKEIYNLDVVVIPTNKPVARKDAHDLIFKNQRAKYTAIANKIEELHQKGQPVLIGTTSVQKNQIVANLLKKKKISHQVLNAKNHKLEAQIIANAGKKGAVTVATNMAGRGVDIILGGPKDDDPKNWKKKHQQILDLGGLYVIGTERHESRRIDNQLRGRAGRQGDPGYSQFYVALDDDLMRIFGGDKISSLMTRFKMPEDTPLTHPLVSKSIEQIQIKVEGYHFDVRKNLVEYDNVINKQRQIVYSLRESILLNAQLKPANNQKELFDRLAKQITIIKNNSFDSVKQQVNWTNFVLEFSEIFPLDSQARSQLEKELAKSDKPELLLLSKLKKQWKQRIDYFGKETGAELLKFAILSSLDPLWVEHLTALDDLRDGVRLRAYAQKDPLVEYRKEAFQMFQKLMFQFEYNLVRKVFRLGTDSNSTDSLTPTQISEGRGEEIALNSNKKTGPSPKASPIKKVKSGQSAPGRNDPCPCGSGKKYKKCCYPKFG
ncbi:preprotein translocase subunit SecA, partial [Candidatus Shapirobacteria bacterium]